MQGPHSRAVSCPLCNEKFFPKSLPFHQKQCQKRRGERIVPCPYCSTEVTQLELPNHIQSCPRASKNSQGRQRNGGPSDAGHHGGGGGAPISRDMGPTQFEPDVAEDGRMRCLYCGRYFNPDRIDKHQSICGGLKNARPRGPDGQPTQTCRKVYNSEAARVGRGTAFVSPEEHERREQRKRAEIEAQARKSQSKWKRDHEEFQAACRAGREPVSPTSPPARASHGVPPGKVPCPHCHRNFDPAAADRHIPICAKVMNKPKPPPSSSPGPSRRGPPASPGRMSSPASPQRSHASPRPSPRPGMRSPRQTATPTPGGRSASCSRLSGSRPPQSPSAPGCRGTGLQAARTLRNSESASRLHSTRTPPPSSHGHGEGHFGTTSETLSLRDGSTPSATLRHPPTLPRSKLDASHSEDTTDDDLHGTPTGSRSSALALAGSHAVSRVGLRRSAMLYRLLSQVPQNALERELQDIGVSPSNLDQERLIEAILERLA